jgi:hypothetical protein
MLIEMGRQVLKSDTESDTLPIESDTWRVRKLHDTVGWGRATDHDSTRTGHDVRHAGVRNLVFGDTLDRTVPLTETRP